MRRGIVRSVVFVTALASAASSGIATAAFPPLFPEVALPVASAVSAVELAHVDGDGTLDAVVATVSNGVSIFYGRGDGTFTPGPVLVGGSIAALAVVDLDGDGRVDVAGVANGTSAVRSWLQQSGGGFGPGIVTTLATGGNRPAVVALDADVDGTADLAASNSRGEVEIWPGVGDGHFDPPAVLTGVQARGELDVFSANPTEDAFDDLAVATGQGVVVLTNDGVGGFVSQRLIATAGAVHGLGTGDLDGDGDDDIVALAGPSVVLHRLLNTGPSTYTATSQTMGLFASMTDLGDLDADGDLDIVFATGIGLSAMLGAGDGTFASRIDDPINYRVPFSLVALGDLDDDGFTDALAASSTVSASVRTGLGNGRFRVREDLVVAGSSNVFFDLSTGDVDRDGDVDVVALEGIGSVLVIPGLGSGAFGTPVEHALPAGTDPQRALLVDLDRDDWLDIVVTLRNTDAVAVLRGLGGGSFGAATVVTVGDQPASATTIAIGSPSAVGVAVANGVSRTITVLVAGADGALSTGATLTLPGTRSPIAVDAGDVDGDGVEDLVVGTNNPGGVLVFRGAADGSFTAAGAPTAMNVTDVAVGDLDGDGLDDVAATLSIPVSLVVMPGSATAVTRLGPPTSYTAGRTPIRVMIGDVTGDELLDVVAVDLGFGGVSVFAGNEDGSLQARTDYAVTFPRAAAIGDFDGDGNGDVIVAGQTELSMLRNLLYPPPAISATVDPPPNAAGWNDEPVIVTFTCTSEHLRSCTAPVVLGSDGAGQFAHGTVEDELGRKRRVHVGPIDIDLTPPTLVGSPVDAPNAAGWYRDDVGVGWTCDDALSGLAALCPGPGVVAGEGTDLSISASIADVAGNVTTASSSPVDIDRTPPVTTASAVPAWSATDVVVMLDASDSLSGVDRSHYTVDDDPTVHAGTSVVVSGEGRHTVRFWSVDRAGNIEVPLELGVDIDLTAPVIDHALSPLPNANGWNRGPVTVTFMCSDALSGIESCTDPVVVTTDGLAQPVTGTAVDRAGNTASRVARVSIDTVAPTIGGSRSGVAGTWSRIPVTVTFTCADELSGVAACTEPVVLSDDGAAQSVPGTTTDAAGNTAATTVEGIDIDATPPSISGSVVDAVTGVPAVPGSSGWFVRPVEVVWSCSDVVSGIAVGACPSPSPVGEGADQVVAAGVDDVAGNHAVASVSVSVDATAPSISGSVVDAVTGVPAVPSVSGWFVRPVEVVWSCSDVVSGIAVGACPSPSPVGEGADQVVVAGVDDVAGNHAVASVSVSVDTNPPETTAGTPSIVGTTATVELTATDAVSGVARTSASVDGAAAVDGTTVIVTGSGSHTVDYWSVDVAGNVEPSHRLDLVIGGGTGPSIVASVSPAPNAAGWNNTPVTVSFACTEGPSPIVSCTAPVTVTAQGANRTVTGTAVDAVGRSVSATATVSIDTTAPKVTVKGVVAGRAYQLGKAKPKCTASDALSGLTGPATLVITGGTPNGVGSITATCTAVDRAGNTSVASTTYLVRYRFTPFVRPVVLAPSVTTVARGRALSIQFGLRTGSGAAITALSAVTSITVQPVAAFSEGDPALAVPAVPAPGTELRYRASDKRMVFDWLPPGPGRHVLFLTLDDGTTRRIHVRVT